MQSGYFAGLGTINGLPAQPVNVHGFKGSNDLRTQMQETGIGRREWPAPAETP
jgi:hypothetical protein